MKNEPITDFIITPHAEFEMRRRGIATEIVQSLLAKPERQFQIRVGRVVLQSRIPMGTSEKDYLVRVFVNIDRSPAEVVTAYRTSKITKYWEEEDS